MLLCNSWKSSSNWSLASIITSEQPQIYGRETLCKVILRNNLLQTAEQLSMKDTILKVKHLNSLRSRLNLVVRYFSVGMFNTFLHLGL